MRLFVSAFAYNMTNHIVCDAGRTPPNAADIHKQSDEDIHSWTQPVFGAFALEGSEGSEASDPHAESLRRGRLRCVYEVSRVVQVVLLQQLARV
jgi:hypothetical protein